MLKKKSKKTDDDGVNIISSALPPQKVDMGKFFCHIPKEPEKPDFLDSLDLARLTGKRKDTDLDTHKDGVMDVPLDGIEDVASGVHPDRVEDVSQDVMKDVASDGVEDVLLDGDKDTASDVHPDRVEDVSQDVMKDVVQDTQRNIMEDVSQDIPMDVQKDGMTDVPRDISSDVARDTPMDVPGDVRSYEIPIGLTKKQLKVFLYLRDKEGVPFYNLSLLTRSLRLPIETVRKILRRFKELGILTTTPVRRGTIAGVLYKINPEVAVDTKLAVPKKSGKKKG